MAFFIAKYSQEAMETNHSLFCFVNPDERRKKMIREATGKVVLRENLSSREMEEVMREIAEAKASPEEIASFLTALRMKGETAEEITAAARVLREKSLKMRFEGDPVCLDREEITVERETILSTARGFAGGTTVFNVSTATSFVVAGAGLKVVRCVRRSLHPLCGCADVIEALGINLDMTSTQLERCYRTAGICFLHEPLLHRGFERVTTIRRRMGIRTLFNLLDPLINPGGAKVQVLGVYDPNLTETMATVLMGLGVERGLVIHGEDTLDEISVTGKTKVTEFRNGELKSYFIEPEDFGIRKTELGEIKGGTREQNAGIILEILRGARGARRDIVLLNAAAVFMVAGRTKNFQEGIEMASWSIDSGRAFEVLQKVTHLTNSETSFLRKIDFVSAEISE